MILLVLLRLDKREFALRHVRDLQVAQSTAGCPIAPREDTSGEVCTLKRRTSNFHSLRQLLCGAQALKISWAQVS